VTDLQFVAISDDGKMIILQTADGEWIEVPFEAKAAGSTPGAVAEELAVLTPREIQSRIRAGASPEQLVAISGSTLDRIMAFAPPILMERSHVATKAGRTIVRRASGAGPLSEVVNARLEPLGVQLDDIEWDSFRRDDGRWTVTVSYPSKDGKRRATYLFDVRNSALVAGDDEARWLIGEVPPKRGETVVHSDTQQTVAYLVAVPTIEPVEISAVETVTEDEVVELPTEKPTDPMLGLHLAPPIEIEEAVVVEISTTTSISFETAEIDLEEVEDAAPETMSHFDRLTAEDTSVVKRPKMPSWDEILFGTTAKDEN